jgi:hypothetical protein
MQPDRIIPLARTLVCLAIKLADKSSYIDEAEEDWMVFKPTVKV